LQPLTIDATTQPGYSGSPIVELNGINAGAGADGLEIRANSTIWGFVINRFTANGLYLFQTGISHIEGNFLGTNISGTSALGNGFCGITISSANNIIGGSIPSARNVISGNLRSGICIVGDDSDNNSIVNSYIGTDVTGNMDLGNLEWGISISQADSTQIGGMVAAQGNVISGNDRSGILFHTGAGLTSITGNLIGTNSSGTADLGNSEQGIRVSDSFQTTIGGITADARNVISGNDGIGISLFGPGISNTEILGNFIGTDLTGSVAIGNGSTGIGIYEATNTFIGALTPGAGNVISANLSGVEIGGSNSTNNFIDGNKIGTDVTGTINLGNTFEGVLITDNSNNNVRNNVVGYNDRGIRVSTSVSVATGNLISKNSVFPSGAGFAPIDLGSDSSTPNDVGDADTGPNNLQNYPELTSFTSDVSSTSIQGTLNSSPNTNFDLEFYSSPNCHSSGHGPGKTFIGTSSVITDASGNVSFDLTFPIPMPSGENFLTAIATNKLTDDTSEFSACLANNAGLLFDDFEDAVETWTFVKGNWGESAGSLIGNGPRATTYAPLPWPNSGLSGCTLCTIAVDFFTTDGGALGKVFLLLWFQDKKTKVELLVREKTDKWVLKEIVGGVVVNKKKGVHEIIPNVSKHVEITFDGANYHVTVEGTPLITMPSAAVPFGNVGFRMKNTGAWFQQILIQ
jgi:titin